MHGIDHFTKEIFTPSVGEVLNVSAATNIYRVKLTDSMASSLRFSKLDDYELARVVGRIHFPDDSTTPSLDVDMPDASIKTEPSIFVGDVRLSEFKKVLQSAGIQAEFKGEGILVCNDEVAVRKVKRFLYMYTACYSTYIYIFLLDGYWSITSRRYFIRGLLQDSFVIILSTCYCVNKQL